MSEQMKEEIIEEIRNLFGDTSVSPETTAQHMKEIIDECEMNLDALRMDGVFI